jgi:hypothetical protein
MAFSGMLRRVAIVRTDVSEELSASIIRVTMDELGTSAITSVRQLLVTADVLSSPILVTLMMETLSSSETYVLTRATRHNIPEDGILLEILKARCIQRSEPACHNMAVFFTDLSGRGITHNPEAVFLHDSC